MQNKYYVFYGEMGVGRVRVGNEWFRRVGRSFLTGTPPRVCRNASDNSLEQGTVTPRSGRAAQKGHLQALLSENSRQHGDG